MIWGGGEVCEEQSRIWPESSHRLPDFCIYSGAQLETHAVKTKFWAAALKTWPVGPALNLSAQLEIQAWQGGAFWLLAKWPLNPQHH